MDLCFLFLIAGHFISVFKSVLKQKYSTKNSCKFFVTAFLYTFAAHMSLCEFDLKCLTVDKTDMMCRL